MAVTLASCDSGTPPQYTIDPAALELELQEAIEQFECGYSTFAWVALGHEDVLESWAGVASSAAVYRASAVGGECDTSTASQAWFDQFMGARASLSNAHGTGLYDLMRAEPPQAEIERLSAIAAIYMAASLAHFGEFFCETTFDGGDLLAPDDVLAMAEEWLTDRALVHIDALGDFALPGGISSSARTLALALRARVRWTRGNLTGAADDAEDVPQGFTAWITRDDGATRRNRVYTSAQAIVYSILQRSNDWWSGSPNPATGAAWPSPIPFTGYWFLGIATDGRAVDDQGHPVRWAEEMRDAQEQPIPLLGGAVADARVPHGPRTLAGPGPYEVPEPYADEPDDIPFVSWREMWLIRAEAAGGQGAIDRVNELRTATGLPEVGYISGATATAEQIRYMVIEERRRELYGEGGRYWATKLRNLDLLWFPRGEGQTTRQGYFLQGGVRLAMPDSVYETNAHLVAVGGLAARGTGCDPVESPVFP